MNFQKYQHIEKLGSPEVDGILLGTCYIFPKLDGANASVWIGDDACVKVASRNQEVTKSDALKGFYQAMLERDELATLFMNNINWRVFGEWLIPHTIKTYRADSWNRFYPFDVVDFLGRYVRYDEYAPVFTLHGVDFIPCIAKIQNPSLEQLMHLVETNDYLMQDGHIGEGIVIKNYDFVNKYGRTTWAKIVRSEFKDANRKEVGGARLQNGPDRVEFHIVEDVALATIAQKVYANLQSEGFDSKQIPKLLGIVWRDFVMEELWTWMKKYKNPTIDFRMLNKLVVDKTKTYLPEIFGCCSIKIPESTSLSDGDTSAPASA